MGSDCKRIKQPVVNMERGFKYLDVIHTYKGGSNMKSIRTQQAKKLVPQLRLHSSCKWILFVLFLSCAHTLTAQGFLKADGKKIVNERGENVLLRGMGLGGWMLQEGYMLRVSKDGQQHKIRERIDSLIGPGRTQEFYDAWLANHTRKIDIDSMKAWGFNSIRLPMHYDLYTLPAAKEPVAGGQTWLQKGFALTDSLLAWCKAAKIYLILDLHGAPGGQGNDVNISDRDASEPSLWESEANRQKVIALWRNLAERYAAEPWIGAYDIINEPNWGFADPADRNGLKEKGNGPLKKLMEDITTAIREVDKKHIIIIEGNGWGNNYNGILPPWDSNMVLSFHKYWNKNDQASIQSILQAREKYQIPVWLGETGENSNVWFSEAVQLLEANNIGWSWWPLKKMGFNNPLEIKSNENYNGVLNYWSGKGEKPAAGSAYAGLLELANSAKLENNIFHKDIIDAMFRQPFSWAARPFNEHRITSNTTIAAVDYDLGRNRVAYFDHDTADYHVSGQPGAGNKGRTYRNDGVDIRKDSGSGESYFVSDMEKGEWLQYTVQVAKKAPYTVKLQVASTTDSSKLSMQINGRTPTYKVTVFNGASGTGWQTQEIKRVFLDAGTQVIRIYADEGIANLKRIAFVEQH